MYILIYMWIYRHRKQNKVSVLRKIPTFGNHSVCICAPLCRKRWTCLKLRAELLVHIISKNLLLIKRILFTMQRLIDPHCFKEGREGCTSVWSCKERSGIYTNSTACPNFTVPQLWDHIYSCTSFFILRCDLSLAKCQAPIRVVCLAFLFQLGQGEGKKLTKRSWVETRTGKKKKKADHSKGKTDSNLKV